MEKLFQPLIRGGTISHGEKPKRVVCGIVMQAAIRLRNWGLFMDDRMAAEAETAARQLLQNFKKAHPGWENDKTPVDAVVTWYGLEVTTFNPDDQPQGTYGWLEPGEDLIWLCRDLPETLNRFTLAHELGHAVLHRSRGEQQQVLEPSPDDPCQSSDVQEAVTSPIDQEQFEEILGSGQAYNPRSQRELAANIFAAELLMPLERVASLYLGRQVAPRGLAGTFGVSTSAMLNRLAGLMMGDHKALHLGRDTSRPFEDGGQGADRGPQREGSTSSR